MKVAKMVLASLLVRVIVDEDATATQIADAAKPKFVETLEHALYENIEEIMEDKEMPFGALATDHQN